MAQRTSSNVKGDIFELEVTRRMLQHGFAINALTASDTGWDLHCHLPEDHIMNAADAPARQSWNMSGRSAHIQVKHASKDKLKVGTVRGWLTGTATGTPTLMFWGKQDGYRFSDPLQLSEWLGVAAQHKSDSESFRYTRAGKVTDKQAPLESYKYSPKRFPAVMALWSKYPAIAMDFESLSMLMNAPCTQADEAPGSAKTLMLVELVRELSKYLWLTEGLPWHAESIDQARLVAPLYEQAGLDMYWPTVEDFMAEREIDISTVASDKYALGTHILQPSLTRSTNSQNPRGSALAIIGDIASWFSNDAVSL